MKKLLIVESPTKAKTIQKFLSHDFKVESSYGHVRDLPRSKMGIDIENDFTPKYVVPLKSKKRVNELKKLAKNAEQVLFATDEDREGEAISWHLQQLLDIPDDKAQRIVFHEITEGAIKNALSHPRPLDTNLVDAQQARRILDRLVGYELSPFLWKKVTKGLSAGRVQSVALRIIVEREREIQKFQTQEYWSIEVVLQRKIGNKESFSAHCVVYKGKQLEKFSLQTAVDTQKILDAISDAPYFVQSLETKEVKKSAPTPFITSSLQQDANRRLRYSTKQTMMIAQQLYEGIETESGLEGLITYMRTDSVTLAESFLAESARYIKEEYGKEYAGGPRMYKTKSKLAQEAHEAIRPTSLYRTPESLRHSLSENQFALYDLIWRRTLGSQLPDARYQTTSLDIAAGVKDDVKAVFRANGNICIFDGFTKVYTLQSDEVTLPPVQKDEVLDQVSIEPNQHFTKPPSRYSEAGLVKVLEEYGIGRPSTYAPTISTLVERNYVQREDRRLKPTDIAFLVNDLLVEHFNNIVDYQFTARMEDELDEVAEGKKNWVPVIRDFYGPFHENLEKKSSELSKKDFSVEETDQICEKCGKPMIIRMGRFGKFLACSGFPECKNAKPIEQEGENQEGAEQVEPCEKCGAPMVAKRGRFGSFYGCSKYPECKNIRNARDKKLDMKCPTCGQGDVVMKRSKRGRTFFGCNKYPECDFVSWTKPEEENKVTSNP